MDVVTGATSTLIPKLTALLQDEYNLQKKVKKDVEYTQKELIFMRAALCKVAEVPPERLDHQVKAWASNVKELSYDMEDAVDTYKVRVMVGGGYVDMGNTFIKSVVEMLDIKKGSARHQLASVIEELMGLTMQLAELRDRYKLDDPGSAEMVQPTTLTQTIPVSRNYPLWTWWHQGANIISSQITDLRGWVHQSRFFKSFHKIGSQLEAIPPPSHSEQTSSLNDDAKEITALLTNKNESMYVCYISGAAGVGKTTFAAELYREVACHFHRRATVRVSQNTNFEDITERIDKQFKQTSSSDDDEPQISNSADVTSKKNNCNRLLKAGVNHNRKDVNGGSNSGSTTDESPDQKNLSEKQRYLLLIDDLWYAETLLDVLLSSQEKYEATTLRVIVTTRFPIVDTPYRKNKFDVYNREQIENGKDILKSKKAIKVYSREQYIENSKDIFKSAWSESSFVSDDRMRDDIPPRLWEMCGENQPFAVAMLAGHVAFNGDMSADGWEQVCSKLVPDSSRKLTADGVRTILSHCYNDMPSEMKTCCLYLSMYPMGVQISRKHLTRRWIAEGFVTRKQGKSEEDVAEEYFDHLIKRKFIQPVERSINWKVKNCQVYDLVHEFVVSKAREENFVTVVGGYWSMAPLSGRVRRLSLTLLPSQEGQPDTNDTDSLKEKEGQPGSLKTKRKKEKGQPDTDGSGQEITMGMDLSHVRSLTLCGSMKGGPLELLKKSPIVQVLDLVDCKNLEKRTMKLIYGMLLLKYLNLRRTNIKELHKDIGKLKHLETLDVRETEVSQLPVEVCQLERLVGIFGGDKRKRKALKLAKKMKLKNMKSLRVLSGIEINYESESAVEDLKHLTNLRKLAIYKLVVTEAKIKELQSSIQYLRCLQILIIEEGSSSFDNGQSFIPKYLTALELSAGWFVNLQDEIALQRKHILLGKIKDLSTLTKLRLPMTVLCQGTTEVLKNLGTLSTLSSLSFYERHKKNPEGQAYEFTNGVISAVQEDTEIIIKDGFENLKLLRFFAPWVPQLSFVDKALPKLERLELRFCNFDGIYGIENLESLQEVYLRVHEEADQFTKDIVKNIADTYNKNDRRVRILCDAY
ncbi:unnamed protein product [Urochloa decumbens]|uniref:Uncharacterized protein n=1 Tax=Urochloa decumbens TaxID=240449 RepID=A0ABC9HFB4_9POAL